ncbi:hypothetical protein B566_EDAN016321 [Ephemera danica]|nr:hypothetical protein B566_EDAN016321 [Ephemera danica]
MAAELAKLKEKLEAAKADMAVEQQKNEYLAKELAETEENLVKLEKDLDQAQEKFESAKTELQVLKVDLQAVHFVGNNRLPRTLDESDETYPEPGGVLLLEDTRDTSPISVSKVEDATRKDAVLPLIYSTVVKGGDFASLPETCAEYLRESRAFSVVTTIVQYRELIASQYQ